MQIVIKVYYLYATRWHEFKFQIDEETKITKIREWREKGGIPKRNAEANLIDW